VRNAVVLVRATVAEAFRDAKRGGGLKSAFADLPAEGLEGITFVLSPNAPQPLRALERNPSGTEKSVCIPYILEGGRRSRVKTGLASTGGLVKSRVCVSVETESAVDGSESGRGRGREEGEGRRWPTPNLYTRTKYTQTSRPRWSHAHTRSAKRDRVCLEAPRFCTSCIMLRHVYSL
jgi:hypothetical protein